MHRPSEPNTEAEEHEHLPPCGRLAVISLVAVVMADVLFYHQPLGWTLGLFAAVLLGGLWWVSPLRALARPRRIALITACALAAFSLVIEPNPAGLVLTGLALITIAVLSRLPWVTNVCDLIDCWLCYVIVGWKTIFRDLRAFTSAESHAPSTESKGIFKLTLQFSPNRALRCRAPGHFS